MYDKRMEEVQDSSEEVEDDVEENESSNEIKGDQDTENRTQAQPKLLPTKPNPNGFFADPKSDKESSV